MGSTAKTAVLYDPHPLWLDALEGMLDRMGVTVAGRTTEPERLLPLVEELQPDLLLADLGPAESGRDSARYVRKARTRADGIKTIVLSSVDDERQIDSAFAAGVDAYVLKSAHRDDIASAVRQAFEHSVYFAHDHRPEAAGEWLEPGAAPELTRRERQILGLAAEGHSNAQLAKMLWVDEHTVKFHLSNVYRKLQVANRTEASRWAQLHGFLPALPVNGDSAAELEPPD